MAPSSEVPTCCICEVVLNTKETRATKTQQVRVNLIPDALHEQVIQQGRFTRQECIGYHITVDYICGQAIQRYFTDEERLASLNTYGALKRALQDIGWTQIRKKGMHGNKAFNLSKLAAFDFKSQRVIEWKQSHLPATLASMSEANNLEIPDIPEISVTRRMSDNYPAGSSQNGETATNPAVEFRETWPIVLKSVLARRRSPKNRKTTTFSRYPRHLGKMYDPKRWPLQALRRKSRKDRLRLREKTPVPLGYDEFQEDDITYFESDEGIMAARSGKANFHRNRHIQGDMEYNWQEEGNELNSDLPELSRSSSTTDHAFSVFQAAPSSPPPFEISSSPTPQTHLSRPLDLGRDLTNRIIFYDNYP